MHEQLEAPCSQWNDLCSWPSKCTTVLPWYRWQVGGEPALKYDGGKFAAATPTSATSRSFMVSAVDQQEAFTAK